MIDSPDLLGWQADVPPLAGCKGHSSAERRPRYRPLDPPVGQAWDGEFRARAEAPQRPIRIVLRSRTHEPFFPYAILAQAA